MINSDLTPLWVALTAHSKHQILKAGGEALLLDECGAEQVRGRVVILVPSHAKANGGTGSAARKLQMFGPSSVSETGNLPGGALDLADLIENARGEVDLISIAAGAVPIAPATRTADPVSYGDVAAAVWPEPLEESAYQGLAGEIVKAIAPNTEADASAILIQVLCAFGALVGRGPHVRVEGDQHHGNLFLILVGETAKARKGTSWGRVKEVFPIGDFVVSGLSSGEGLKYRVRDPIQKTEKDKKTGAATLVEVDPGVFDKRLLVIEPEFAQVLRQGARAGNTLSATVRCAWDTGTLETLTKNDPIKATGAHICIVGHITADELRAELTSTDTANGFANRFIFMAVKRSKVLPFGGDTLDADKLADFGAKITMAATKARTHATIAMTPSARGIWEKIYPRLSEGMPGLYGAVTARSEAQCLRLALIFTLLDGASSIDAAHLVAAMAVWERSEASARFIFGSAVGDPVADEILRALRSAGKVGMTRTDIMHLFKRNLTADRISMALELLVRRGLAAMSRQETTGRPAEIWRAA